MRALRDRIFWHVWSPRTALWVVVAIGVVGLVVAMLGENPEGSALFFVGGLAWVSLGAYHRTRSTDPIGAWAVLVGAAWLIGRLDDSVNGWAYTAGNLLSLATIPPGIVAFAGFPAGRLSTCHVARDPRTRRPSPTRIRALRALVCAAVVAAVPLNVWVLLGGDTDPTCPTCDRRLHTLTDLPGLARVLQLVQVVVLVAALAAMVWCFERTFRAASGPQRAIHAPVRIGLAATVGLATAHLIALRAENGTLAAATLLVVQVTMMMIPLLYGIGLHRGGEIEAAALARLEADPARDMRAVETALRDALGEPDLHLVPIGTAGAAPGVDARLVRDLDGTPLAVLLQHPAAPDSRLRRRALGWAAARLAPSGPVADADAATRARVADLSDAELVTALHLAQQRSNREIAGSAGLALGTVNNRVSRIYRTLGLSELSRRERTAVVARLRAAIVAEMRERGVDSG